MDPAVSAGSIAARSLLFLGYREKLPTSAALII